MSEPLNSLSLRFHKQPGLVTGQTAGQRFFLSTAPLPAGLPAAQAEALPLLRAGQLLRGEQEEHRVLGRFWWPGLGTQPDAPCWLVETLVPAPTGLDDVRSLALSRSGFALAWITLSDKGAAGPARRRLGPAHRGAGPLRDAAVFWARGFVLPDEERQIAALLHQLALVERV